MDITVTKAPDLKAARCKERGVKTTDASLRSDSRGSLRPAGHHGHQVRDSAQLRALTWAWWSDMALQERNLGKATGIHTHTPSFDSQLHNWRDTY